LARKEVLPALNVGRVCSLSQLPNGNIYRYTNIY